METGKNMYPLKMKPVFKDYFWGGTRLIDDYGKKTDMSIVAESWELSCHHDGQSTIENGVLTGQTLTKVLVYYPEWMGRLCDNMTELPILVKLIDARESLSLQVHPNDEFAHKVERQTGKNEMWYVAEASPEAELILGFKDPMSRSDIKSAILNQELLSTVRRIPVQKGDCYCVPAGMLHAIGGGVVIIEIQQASNVTYRVYDYSRKDHNGNEREIHIEKALDVLDTTLKPQKITGRTLTVWPFFKSKLIAFNGGVDICCGYESFHSLIVVEGQLSLEWSGGELLLKKGETVFIPAGIGKHHLKGIAKVILISMN